MPGNVSVPYSSGGGGGDDYVDDYDEGASAADGSTGTWSSGNHSSSGKADKAQGEQGQNNSSFSVGKEAKAVRLWRAAVIVSLIVGTVAISVAMWFLLAQQDESTYQAAYAVVTRTVEATSTQQVAKLHEAIMMVSDVLTATAKAENLTWPFVSVTRQPFEVLGHQARLQSGAEFIFVTPFVSEEQRREWLNYSFENFGWYEQGKVVAGMLSKEPRTYVNGSIGQEMFTLDGPSPVINGTRKHCPVWQSSPPPYLPNVVNYDNMVAHYHDPAIEAMERTRARTGVFSNVFPLGVASALLGSPPRSHGVSSTLLELPVA
jgi:hypothetical protein